MNNKKVDNKIKIFVIGVFIVFIVVILKVFYIQVFEYDKLNNLASDLWSRNLPLEADRGKIYDRNGIVLADNITTTSLVLIPNQIKNKEEVTIESNKDLETPVVAKEEIKEEKKTTRTTTRKKNTVKTVCRVLVATPSYFVIDKNGEKITVNKKNNYHRNEEILY